MSPILLLPKVVEHVERANPSQADGRKAPLDGSLTADRVGVKPFARRGAKVHSP